MNAFAALLDRLVYEPGRNNKLRLIADYLRTTPDPERGFALAALTGALSFQHAKAGVIRLTRFAAVSYADRGVRVNCIAPGVTPTEAYNKAGKEMGQMVIDHLLEYQPIKRTIATSEQADAIAWLCSNEAAMVTGHVLPVDGGWTAR